VIYDLKHGKVLDVLETRVKAVVVAWFRSQPKAWLAGIRRAAMDMWEAYEKAIREVFGDQVEIVADKFHVVKQFNERIQACRREIQRGADEKTKQPLKGIRWAIAKDPKNLTQGDRRALGQALKASPELRTMYRLKKQFLSIYWVKTRKPLRQMRKWMQRALATGLKHLAKFVQTLKNWWEEITAYFRTGLTNAGSEGLNTTIKMVTRRAYGFRNHEHFRLRVKHETGALAA